MGRRTIRTPKARAAFLDALEVTCSVEKACHTAGLTRSAVYRWREDDADFKAAWEDVINGIVDDAHAKMLQQARTDDSPAGVTARNIILRAYLPEIYNPNLVLRRDMLRLALEKQRLEMPPLIEGRAIMENGIRTDFIHTTAMPFNWRTPTPHAPKFDPYGDDAEALREILPVEQDGSGQAMPLPEFCVCVHHEEPHEYLPASLLCDGQVVDPKAATDLWFRIRAHNHWLAKAYPILAAQAQNRMAAPQDSMSEDPPPDDSPHPEDDDPPDEIDYSGGFGRP
jgi:hypothetical protein